MPHKIKPLVCWLCPVMFNNTILDSRVFRVMLSESRIQRGVFLMKKKKNLAESTQGCYMDVYHWVYTFLRA